MNSPPSTLHIDGVFRENPDETARGENHGGHVIKVIGWGKDDAADG